MILILESPAGLFLGHKNDIMLRKSSRILSIATVNFTAA